MYEACVIGCGQIGMEVLKELSKVFGPKNVAGVDIQPGLFAPDGIWMHGPEAMPDAKVYIISLWTMESIVDSLDQLLSKNPNFILIESTIDPTWDFGWHRLADKIAFFPHRFNPNDPEHHIFNQPRLLASIVPDLDKQVAKWLVETIGMKPSHVIMVDSEIAQLAKVVENAYRAMEIILAQEIKKVCDDQFVDFEDLRKACNTKWNIDIREAKDGVKGKCLPKDLAFFNKFFQNNMLFRLGEMLNNEYIKSCDKK